MWVIFDGAHYAFSPTDPRTKSTDDAWRWRSHSSKHKRIRTGCSPSVGQRSLALRGFGWRNAPAPWRALEAAHLAPFFLDGEAIMDLSLHRNALTMEQFRMNFQIAIDDGIDDASRAALWRPRFSNVFRHLLPSEARRP